MHNIQSVKKDRGRREEGKVRNLFMVDGTNYKSKCKKCSANRVDRNVLSRLSELEIFFILGNASYFVCFH